MIFAKVFVPKGLCKLEHYGKASSIQMLLRLCKRLGLTVDEIFPTGPHSYSIESKLLDEAEFELIQSDYRATQQKINQA